MAATDHTVFVRPPNPPATSPSVTGRSAVLADTVEEPRRKPFS